MSSKNGNARKNKQQPRQQGSQPKSNAFGFGAFGSTSTFGQPQQPQSANPMFGNLGAPSTSTSTFGLFAQNTKPETTTFTFGVPKPATGFGASGGCTTTFDEGTSAFGFTGTSLFGSTTNTGGTFGSGGEPDGGNNPATSLWGRNLAAPITTGTASPPFSAYSEKDPASSVPLQYQTISAMQTYRSTSIEELRVQDYQQGRTGASSKLPFGFGAPTTQPAGTFGAATTQQPNTSPTFEFGKGREYFKAPHDRSARIFRHDGTRASALNIISHLLDNDSTSITDEHEKFAYTAAGERPGSALREQAQSHDEKLRSLRAEMEAEMKAKDETRQEVQEELEKKREELARIKQDVERMTERFVSEKARLESRIAEMEATNRQHVERLQDMQSQVSQALLQVMKSQTETARQKEQEERQARILAEERLVNVLARMKNHEELQAVQTEMNDRLHALQDKMSSIMLEKKADGQHQTDPEATKTSTNGQAKDREMNRKGKGWAKGE